MKTSQLWFLSCHVKRKDMKQQHLGHWYFYFIMETIAQA